MERQHRNRLHRAIGRPKATSKIQARKPRPCAIAGQTTRYRPITRSGSQSETSGTSVTSSSTTVIAPRKGRISTV